MTDTTSDPTTEIRHAVTVGVDIQRAFQVFTRRFDEIKPREHTLLAVPIAETVMEPWVGGRLYDRGADGDVCQWGRVLVVDEPRRIVFSWDISPQWQVETDPDRCSEVEVTFEPEAADRTLVTITHRHLDRHGDGWQHERDAVSGPNGWPLYGSRLTRLLD